MKKIALSVLLALAVAFVALGAGALASTSMTDATSPAATDPGWLDLARPVYDAVVHGNYALAAAAFLVLAVALVRRYAGPKVPFLHSDAGGALLTLVGSFGGALATALAAGGAVFSGHLAWVAFMIAITAAGGYGLIKKLLVVPFLVPLSKRAPAWMQPLFQLILWVFDRPDPVAKAEAAGTAAVAAKPSTGVTGIIGKLDDLE